MCLWLQAELDKISLDKVRNKPPGPAMLHHKEIFSYQSRQQAIVAPLAEYPMKFTLSAHDLAPGPPTCRYVGNYMLGTQYRDDSRLVVYEAIAYAESLKLVGDGKDVWVFDIDETTLSNLPYYVDNGLGGSSETGTALVYKSNKRKMLEQNGYRIVGNIGDQWSGILGTNTGYRTFKLPDPMYYVA
ncbi:acid phosphatase 1-like [Vitis riparia]|uniref:acid phosphatase 1-like n=1 Tax=Vitis riparia TaxID=96939 RepID=UPI00155B2F55|nr:acid phosphatase 1-like [Vitis riparia]